MITTVTMVTTVNMVTTVTMVNAEKKYICITFI